MLRIPFIFIMLLFLTPQLILSQNETKTDSFALRVKIGEVLILSGHKSNDGPIKMALRQNELEVSNTLALLPSVIFTNVGMRNEGMIYLRGFDLRSIPVFMDGIPMYLPYDGYVDLNRFLLADLSKIELSKGSASVLYGPNTIGGAINLVGKRPENKLEIDARAGIMNGGGKHAAISLGSKIDKFYIQGNFAFFNKEFTKLPASFETSDDEKDLELDNSWRKDLNGGIKLGYIPFKGHEYAFHYNRKHGEKGNPVYLGNDPNIRKRYWRWPYWDKESFYFLSNTKLGKKSFLRTRVYLDKFKNRLESFDDQTLTTQNAKYAFNSIYNDKVYGLKTDFGSLIYDDHYINSTIQYKNDLHDEFDDDHLQRRISDKTLSFGIEDQISVSDGFRLIPGIAYMYRYTDIAMENVPPSGGLSELPLAGNGIFNLQLSSYFDASPELNFKLTLARKSRFATMEDRYSYKLGRAIPNPDLSAEIAYNTELAINWVPKQETQIHFDVFTSSLDQTIQLVDNVEEGISQMQNTGMALFYGIDFGFDALIIPHLTFKTEYTFIKRKNLSNPQLLFIDVPEHHMISNLKFQFFPWMNFSAGCEFNSERYSTSYGTTASSFLLLHSNLEVSFKKVFSLNMGIKNLADVYYERTEGYPGEGRSFFVSFRYKYLKKYQ